MEKIIESLALCVFLFLLLMIPGIVLRKTRLTSEKFGRDITNLIIYIAQPIMVFVAFLRPFDIAIAKRAGIVFLLAVASHFIAILIAFLSFRKTEKGRQTVLRFAVIFSNAGFMGIPLINYVLGKEAVIYASVYVVVFNIFAWTLGFYMYSGNKKYVSLKMALTNPTTIATLAGILAFVLHLYNFLPQENVLYDALNSIKELVAPLSMFIVGYRMPDALKGIRTLFDRRFSLALILRLLVCPALVFCLLFVLTKAGICNDHTSTAVVLISAATPTATMTSMLAEKFDGDAAYASAMVSVSTVLSLISMPIISYLLTFL